MEEATWERELEVREKYPNLFVDVWPCNGIFVILLNVKSIVCVLRCKTLWMFWLMKVYFNIVYVKYIVEMQAWW